MVWVPSPLLTMTVWSPTRRISPEYFGNNTKSGPTHLRFPEFSPYLHADAHLGSDLLPRQDILSYRKDYVREEPEMLPDPDFRSALLLRPLASLFVSNACNTPVGISSPVRRTFDSSLKTADSFSKRCTPRFSSFSRYNA